MNRGVYIEHKFLFHYTSLSSFKQYIFSQKEHPVIQVFKKMDGIL